MSPNWPDLILRSVVAKCTMVHACSLSVIGSAATSRAASTSSECGEPGDLDLHVVVPRWTPAVAGAVLGSISTTLQDLAEADGRAYQLETRHGPFKPPPDRQIRQVHLIADDLESLERSPWALRWQRAATGRVLLGRGEPPTACPLDRRLSEARRELIRWRDGLLASEIPFRHWRGGQEMRLVDGRVAITDEWEQQCLLRAARRSVQLQVQSLALFPDALAPVTRTAVEEVSPFTLNALDTRRLLAHIEGSLDVLRKV
jgi:hypothetical protein